MHILVTNDDGVFAPGIIALANALSATSHVTVLAPDRNRSAASNSLTLDTPVRVRKLPNGYYCSDGTPTDCVHLAMTGWMETLPHMVVSGINEGANLGDDVIYSGTVAAAMEGRNLGYPAIAVSLVSVNPTSRHQLSHYGTAAKVVLNLITNIIKNPLPKDTILNVNVPDVPYEELKGVRITRLGQRHRAEAVEKTSDPRGYPIYWIGPPGVEQDCGVGTDFHAINEKCVSVTPLQIDLTRYSAIDPLSKWLSDFTL